MKQKIPVYWMHCKACEILIENKISEIAWVKVENISQKENFIEVNVKSKDLIPEIQKSLIDLWYKSEDTDKKNSFFDYTIIFLTFIIFGLLFFLFKDVEFFSSLLKTENMSILFIILIWFVASLSTCLAVTWWIIVWFSKYIDTSNNTYSHLKTQTKFHIGRILWFAIFGWILWSIWGFIWSFWMLNKVFLGIAWIFMLYMWLNMLWFIKYKLSLPKIFWTKILNIKNPVFAPLIWALTFFLPCWFTQSMQVYAISSGSFFSWAMIMWAFALGTLPVLFAIGFWSSYLKDKNFHYLNKVIGVLVVYFGLFILAGFANMFHINLWASQTNQSISSENNGEIQEINVSHNGYSFDDIILSGSQNYRITIIPESDGLGCMFTLTVPWLDGNQYLVKKWVPIVLNLKNPKPWTYKAVCTSMWMEQGKIIVR